jgi:hypothetical protein
MEYRVAMYMCMLKPKYLKYFKYAARWRVRAWRLRFATVVTTTCLRSKLKTKSILKNTFYRKSNGNLISQLKILILFTGFFLRTWVRATSA